MSRALPVILVVVLTVWSLVDCLTTPRHQVRNLPKPLWAVVIVLLPVIGPAGWLLGGRPRRERAARRPPAPPPRPVAPDDDPDFLATLEERRSEEHDELLRKWEQEQQRSQGNGADPASGNSDDITPDSGDRRDDGESGQPAK